MRTAQSRCSSPFRFGGFILLLLLTSGVLVSSNLHAQSTATAAALDSDVLAQPLEAADANANNSNAAIQDKKSPITKQSANLLKMALDLKNEVNRTTQNTISAGALRKADEIEKLAKEITSDGHESTSH